MHPFNAIDHSLHERACIKARGSAQTGPHFNRIFISFSRKRGDNKKGLVGGWWNLLCFTGPLLFQKCAHKKPGLHRCPIMDTTMRKNGLVTGILLLMWSAIGLEAVDPCKYFTFEVFQSVSPCIVSNPGAVRILSVFHYLGFSAMYCSSWNGKWNDRGRGHYSQFVFRL